MYEANPALFFLCAVICCFGGKMLLFRLLKGKATWFLKFLFRKLVLATREKTRTLLLESKRNKTKPVKIFINYESAATTEFSTKSTLS